MRVRFTYGRSTQDPEKSVLPSIIYAAKVDDAGYARGVFAGWWDFYVGILWAKVA